MSPRLSRHVGLQCLELRPAGLEAYAPTQPSLSYEYRQRKHLIWHHTMSCMHRHSHLCHMNTHRGGILYGTIQWAVCTHTAISVIWIHTEQASYMAPYNELYALTQLSLSYEYTQRRHLIWHHTMSCMHWHSHLCHMNTHRASILYGTIQWAVCTDTAISVIWIHTEEPLIWHHTMSCMHPHSHLCHMNPHRGSILYGTIQWAVCTDTAISVIWIHTEGASYMPPYSELYAPTQPSLSYDYTQRSVLYGTIQWAVCTHTAISVIWIPIEEASYMAPYNELYALTQPSLSHEYTQRRHLIWHHTMSCMHWHSHLCHMNTHRGSILYATIQWAVCTDTAISVIWIHREEASYMAPYNELYARTQPSLSHEYTQRRHLIWHHTMSCMHQHSHLCHMNTHRGCILYGTIQWAVCTDTAISVTWIHTEEASYMAPYNELYALTQPSLSYEYIQRRHLIWHHTMSCMHWHSHLSYEYTQREHLIWHHTMSCMHWHSHLCHMNTHRGGILYGTIQWAVCTDTAISVIWIHTEEASYMAPYNELYALTQPSLSYEYTQSKHLIWHHTMSCMHRRSYLCHMNTHKGSILYGTIQWAVCTDTAISVIWIHTEERLIWHHTMSCMHPHSHLCHMNTHRGGILYGTIQWAVCTDTAISVIWIHREEASYMPPHNELYALTQPSLSYEYTERKHLIWHHTMSC